MMQKIQNEKKNQTKNGSEKIWRKQNKKKKTVEKAIKNYILCENFATLKNDSTVGFFFNTVLFAHIFVVRSRCCDSNCS